MNNVKVFLCTATMLIMFSNVWGFQKNVSQPDCTMPKDVANIINAKYREWKLQTVKDLSDGDRKLWMKYASNSCPGIIKGHFINSKYYDYAVLLVPKNRDKKGLKIIVITRNDNNGTYTSLSVLDAMESYSDGHVLHIMKPGTYENYEGKNIEVKMDGIILEKIESGSIMYYWSNNKFNEIITDD